MNGPHDLGGMDGFGRVPYQAEEPVFHEPWEGRTFALLGAGMVAGLYGTPVFRHSMERIEPPRYLASSYFERWSIGLATLLVESGAVTAEELDAALGEPMPRSLPVRAPRLASPGPDVTEPCFRVGDAVRVRNEHPVGHTRCPRYVRGRVGTVTIVHGPGNLDDVEAHSDGKRLEPVYAVRFEGSELWGATAEPRTSVTIDLFESYLEAS
ncbi:MAG TPA: nitrile hydratase subunit beta [Actinomycetota bacterium]|nr:nitrile hydratase subunit beta [Actinomycetota bacterium]